MTKLRGGLLLASLLLISPLHAAGLQHAFIAFNDGLPANIAAEMTQRGVADGQVFPTINAVAVVAPRVVLEAYARDPRVRAVTLQRRLALHSYSSRPQVNAAGLQDAGEETHAGSTLPRPAVTGAGVTVAIIDSGIFLPHPDFGLPGASRVIAGANFEFSLLARQAGVMMPAVWDAYATGSEALALQDEVGHGTHVAGIVGADGTAASGLDIGGMAPGAQLVALKIASAGNGVVEDIGFEANAVAAIDYMIRNREALGNVRVANSSWGLLENEAQGLLGPTDFDPVREVTLAAVEAGIVMVFSAGNDGPGPDTVRPIPNGMDEVITVAAACKADRGACPAGGITGFSSRGDSVDITAPGDQIISTSSVSVLEPLGQAVEGDYFGDALQDELQNRAAYTRLSGTSMSSPHIAGIVALMLQANPALTPAQVEDVLLRTADDMVIADDPELLPGHDNASGFGMVNAGRAVALAASMAAAPASLPSRRADASRGGGGLGLGMLALSLLWLGRRRHRG